ncbi:MAG TPA: crosslink repair DNA glycosylase YcaQ family protein [Candidatus Xenobia bacterium]|jgi:hypothetical protein
MNEKLTAWWAHRQGLDAHRYPTSAEALAATGWSRSVGGCTPYLALRSRTGAGRAGVDGDVAAAHIHELPAVRGCTYVVPAQDFGLALRAARGKGEPAELVTARKHCGVTDAEIEKAQIAVLDALRSGPLSPEELRTAVGGAVRNLGEVGKKRGMTTTLPVVLGLLQGVGRIRRVPVNGRLDQQRYRYMRWDPPPTCDLSLEEVHRELARRFFAWAGPATVAQFYAWSALSKRDATTAVQPLRLAEVEGGLLMPDLVDEWHGFRPPSEPRYALVGSLDNATHLHRDIGELLEPGDADRAVWGEKGTLRLGGMSDLNHHAILDRGRLMGFWEYDKAARRVVWSTFSPPPTALKTDISRLEAYIREDLEDARTFSLDSPESRAPRLEALTAR